MNKLKKAAIDQNKFVTNNILKYKNNHGFEISNIALRMQTINVTFHSK